MFQALLRGNQDMSAELTELPHQRRRQTTHCIQWDMQLAWQRNPKGSQGEVTNSACGSEKTSERKCHWTGDLSYKQDAAGQRKEKATTRRKHRNGESFPNDWNNWEGNPKSRGYMYTSVIWVGKESAYNAGDLGSIPGLGRSPGKGNGNPLQYSCFLPGESHEQRSLAGYSPGGRKSRRLYHHHGWFTLLCSRN